MKLSTVYIIIDWTV